MTDDWRVRYEKHLRSEQWAKLKREIIGERGYCCERCGDEEWPLELHHKTYERLGHERPEDLELLCCSCHAIADEERADHAAMQTYARKKYGDDWEEDIGWEVVEEEFDCWLECKADYADWDDGDA